MMYVNLSTHNDPETSFFNHVWNQQGGSLKNQNNIKEKIKVLLNTIPHDVKTILDIGCGDGAITNTLAEKYTVTAVDKSPRALTYLLPTIVSTCCSAEKLPFSDTTFDLVLSSQLLEHLPTNILLNAIQEMKRVSKKYILISVPYNEPLRKRYIYCHSCKRESHIYGHVQQFTLKRLVRLLDGHTLIYSTVCGVEDKPSLNIFSWLKNKIARNYFDLDIPWVCPSCGAPLQKNKRSTVHKIIGRILGIIERGIVLIMQKRSEKDWLIVLFEKK